MMERWRRRRRWPCSLIAVGVATTCLLLLIFGTSGASASTPTITTTHAVDVLSLADCNVAAVDTATTAPIAETTLTTTGLVNTIDTTHWGTTTQLHQNVVVLPASPVEIIEAVFVTGANSQSWVIHVTPIQRVDLTQQYVTSRQAVGMTDVTLSRIITGALLE